MPPLSFQGANAARLSVCPQAEWLRLAQGSWRGQALPVSLRRRQGPDSSLRIIWQGLSQKRNARAQKALGIVCAPPCCAAGVLRHTPGLWQIPEETSPLACAGGAPVPACALTSFSHHFFRNSCGPCEDQLPQASAVPSLSRVFPAGTRPSPCGLADKEICSCFAVKEVIAGAAVGKGAESGQHVLSWDAFLQLQGVSGFHSPPPSWTSPPLPEYQVSLHALQHAAGYHKPGKTNHRQLAPWLAGGARELKGTYNPPRPLLQPPEHSPSTWCSLIQPHRASIVMTGLPSPDAVHAALAGLPCDS